MAYPILAPRDTWYSQGGTTVKRATITEINIKNSYIPTGTITAQWDASAAKNGSITVYVEGTILTIAGNGSGKIQLSEDASYTFGISTYSSTSQTPDITNDAFINVKVINGLTLLDTSKTTSFYRFFHHCESLISVDVSGFNTSHVINMHGMFYRCHFLTSIIGFSNWDTSKVKDFAYFLYFCHRLPSVDVSSFDTSAAETIKYMFYHCPNITSIDVSQWDTKNVRFAGDTFRDCALLNNLNVSNWDTSSMTEIDDIFNGCAALENIDVSNWNTSNVVDMDSVFEGCSNLISVDVSNWDTSKVIDMHGVFRRCSKLTSIDVSNWDTSNVTTMHSVFRDCTNLTSVDVSNWNTSNATSITSIFYNCTNLTSIDVSKWNVSKATGLYRMFRNCTNLTSVDVSKWNAPNATDLSDMFLNCTKLTALNINGLNPIKATNISYMFSGCDGITKLDLSNWRVKPTDIRNLFARCSSLKEVRLDNFDTTIVGQGITTANVPADAFKDLFLDINNLEEITIGPNFSFTGIGTPVTPFVFPSSTSGTWYTVNRTAYLPSEIPEKTKQTYYATIELAGKVVQLIQSGTISNIADAIREKLAITEKITPLEMPQMIKRIIISKEEQQKTLSVTKNGTYIIDPDPGKTLSQVIVEASGYPKPITKKLLIENGYFRNGCSFSLQAPSSSMHPTITQGVNGGVQFHTSGRPSGERAFVDFFSTTYNLTDYKTIYIQLSIDKTGYGWNMDPPHIKCALRTSMYGSESASVIPEYSSGTKQTVKMDITNISGAYGLYLYLSARSYGSDNTAYIYNMWLE